MKKFLLLAVAALMVGTASAQLAKRQKVGKPVTKHQMIQKAAPAKKFEIAGAKAGVKAVKVAPDKFSKHFAAKNTAINNLQPAGKFRSSRAATLQAKYEGSGTLRSTSQATEWEMESGTVTSEGQEYQVIKNLIPNIFGWEEGVLCEYTQEDGKILIAPELIASFPSEEAPTGTYYIFLESATSNDGSITLNLEEDGSISGAYDIIYSVYPAETYDFEQWVGTYDGISKAQYTLPGENKVPTVSFEPNSLVLFAGIGLNGYSFNSNLAMTGANAPVSFTNRTIDRTTAWNWSVSTAGEETNTVYETGDSKDFDFNAKAEDVYTELTLQATNNTVQSKPFVFGCGKYIDEDTGEAHYTESYLYSGSGAYSFVLNSEIPATMTRQDPDGDLTFYTNWATPDKASNSMSKIYCYHERPSTPLYIEGITLPLVNYTCSSESGVPDLHVKIYEVSYTEGSKPTLGRLIAQGDATENSINADYDMGLTGIEFELYMEDEVGLEKVYDHIFLDTDFIIAIEGWDSGTFTGVLGSQDAPLDNAKTSTWFEMTGEEGSMYAYNSWKTSLLVGLLGATYGYLYTEDSSNLTIPAEGGQASMHILPMYSNSEADEYGSKVRLFLDDDSDEIPDWLEVGFANESEETSEYDLVFQADALPSGVTSRQASLILFQEGAQLEITVTQSGNGTSISTITNKADATAPAYNVAGQRVNNNFKGLVVKGGKKMMNK